jgi:hypothetical protein
MKNIILHALKMVGITCEGDFQFYRWVDGSPEGLVQVASPDHFKRMIEDPGEAFCIDMMKVRMESKEERPFIIDSIGFKLEYDKKKKAWSIQSFPDTLDLPHESYSKESGIVDQKMMGERIQLLTAKICSTIDLITMVVTATT